MICYIAKQLSQTGRKKIFITLLIACIAWGLEQSEQADKAAKLRKSAAKPQGGAWETPGGFATSFHSLAAFSACSDCLSC